MEKPKRSYSLFKRPTVKSKHLHLLLPISRRERGLYVPYLDASGRGERAAQLLPPSHRFQLTKFTLAYFNLREKEASRPPGIGGAGGIFLLYKSILSSHSNALTMSSTVTEESNRSMNGVSLMSRANLASAMKWVQSSPFFPRKRTTA
jgi:hypothetical protein